LEEDLQMAVSLAHSRMGQLVQQAAHRPVPFC
jgi:hypothetical protein